MKKQLQERELSPEDWGGDTIVCEVSATKGTGIDHLLEMMALQAEVMELKASPTATPRGTVIEAQVEPGRGPTATVIVQMGTLKTGDPFICGDYGGKIKSLMDDQGKQGTERSKLQYTGDVLLRRVPAVRRAARARLLPGRDPPPGGLVTGPCWPRWPRCWPCARRWPASGWPPGSARRLAIAFLLSVAAMTASPTKWSQHFGDLAGLGPAVLALGLVVAGPGALRDRPRRRIAGFAAGTAVAALVLSGPNLWPSVSGWFTPSFSTSPVGLAGVPLATATLLLGGLVVLAVLARAIWLRSGDPREPGFAVPRRLPAPAPLLAVLLVAVLVLQVGSLARVGARAPGQLHPDHRRGGHPLRAAVRAAAAAVGRAAPRGRALVARPGPPASRSRRCAPSTSAAARCPGSSWPTSRHTGWFALDAAQRTAMGGTLPVVVTVSGPLRVADQLFVEFGDDAGQVVSRRRIAGPTRPRWPPATPSATSRQPAPPSATAVRLAVEAPPAGPAPVATVSMPRVPRLTPLVDVLPPGSTAVLDSPIAFQFPCLLPASLPLGTASLPVWRVAPPGVGEDAGITYRPSFGGPFAGPRLLVTEQRMATYLAGDPVRRRPRLRRWVPIEPLRWLTHRRRAGHHRLDRAGTCPGARTRPDRLTPGIGWRSTDRTMVRNPT